MKLSGYEAIEYAEEHGLLLNKYSDPIEGARKGLSTDEAREIAREDDTLIYVEHVPDREQSERKATEKQYYVIWSGEGEQASKRELKHVTEQGIKRILTRERCSGDRWAKAFVPAYGVSGTGVDIETGEARPDVFRGDELK